MPKILIVDDDLDFQEFLSVFLELEGYEVVCAYDGPSALKAMSSDPRPDLVLLDVLMPGMDGFEVCMALLSDRSVSPPPVVFVSAVSDDDHVRRGLALGAVHYIGKPLDIVELLKTVTDVVSEPSDAAES